MSRNEDYLDDLLSSVSDANRRNNKKDIESLIESMNQEPIKQRERERVQPQPRRDFGEKFVREFEQEIALGSADDFLRDFEMELDEEAADSQSDIEVDQKDERQDVIDNVSDIVDGAKRRLETDGYEEDSAMQEEASVTDVFSEEGVDSALQSDEDTGADFGAEEPMQDETSVLSEHAESEGQMMDESVDLMDILSGDDELSDIGEMLKADEEGEPLGEADGSADSGETGLIGLGDEDMDDTAEEEELQDEFDRLGSIDELKAIGEKKKRKRAASSADC